jgi:dTDP-D-glucose 4,6-dehydratase
MEKNIPFSITRNIKHHFGFLFGKGYKIRDAIYSHEYFGNWMIVFESPDCIIKIYNDRNCLDLTFSPVGVIDNYQISLGPMIF